MLICFGIESNLVKFSLFVQGWSIQTMTYMLNLLIPLLIAYKNKERNMYGITTPGTVMAVVNTGYYICVYSIYCLSQFAGNALINKFEFLPYLSDQI